MTFHSQCLPFVSWSNASVIVSAICVPWPKDSLCSVCHLCVLVRQSSKHFIHSVCYLSVSDSICHFLGSICYWQCMSFYGPWPTYNIYSVSGLSVLAKRQHLQCLPFEFLDKKAVFTIPAMDIFGPNWVFAMCLPFKFLGKKKITMSAIWVSW